MPGSNNSRSNFASKITRAAGRSAPPASKPKRRKGVKEQQQNLNNLLDRMRQTD